MNILPEHKKDFIKNEFVFRSSSLLFSGLVVVFAFFTFLVFMWSMFLDSSISNINRSKKFYEDSLDAITQEGKKDKMPELVNTIYSSKKIPIHTAIFESFRLISNFNGSIFIKLVQAERDGDKTKVELQLEASSRDVIVDFIKLIKAEPSLSGVDMEKVIGSISREQNGAIAFSMSFDYNDKYATK